MGIYRIRPILIGVREILFLWSVTNPTLDMVRWRLLPIILVMLRMIWNGRVSLVKMCPLPPKVSLRLLIGSSWTPKKQTLFKLVIILLMENGLNEVGMMRWRMLSVFLNVRVLWNRNVSPRWVRKFSMILNLFILIRRRNPVVRVPLLLILWKVRNITKMLLVFGPEKLPLWEIINPLFRIVWHPLEVFPPMRLKGPNRNTSLRFILVLIWKTLGSLNESLLPWMKVWNLRIRKDVWCFSPKSLFLILLPRSRLCLRE